MIRERRHEFHNEQEQEELKNKKIVKESHKATGMDQSFEDNKRLKRSGKKRPQSSQQ